MERKFGWWWFVFLVVTLLLQQVACSNEESGAIEYMCPVDFSELDEMVANENWSVVSFKYKAYILPDYFMKNVTNGQPGTLHKTPTVEFLSNMKFTLEKYAYDEDEENTQGQGSLISQIHCNFTDMLHLKTRIFSPENNNNIAEPTSESSMGYLYFEDLSMELESERYYELPAMFTLGDVALPSVKGMYTISVARPTSRNYTIISNMPKYKTKPHLGVDGLVWDVFQETLPLYPEQLSVYIVGGTVERVDYQDEEMNRTISVIWRPELISKMNEKPLNDGAFPEIHNCYAKLAAKLLTIYEELFDVKYPLDKLDIIVTSKKFNYHPWLSGRKSVGVTDVDLSLYAYHSKDGACTKDQVQHMQPLISAIIQQWTGTIEMSSSKHSKTVWLAVLDHLILWGIDNVMGHKFGMDKYLHWMIYDMAMDPNFHRRTEPKMTAIFNMLQDLFTRPVFEEAIIGNFIKRAHNPENGRYETDDVFDAIQEAIELHNKTHLLPNRVTVKDIIENWLETQGPPLIRVEVLSSDQNSYSLIISQETEPTGGGDNETFISGNSTQNGFWIPLEIVTDSEMQFTWLSNTKKNITTTFSTPMNNTKFVLVNPNITGDFRIIYDLALTNLLTKQLTVDHSVLPGEMKSRLIQDYFLFARKGYIGMDSALEMTRYLEGERDPLVWLVVTSNINYGYWASGINAVTYEKLQNYFNAIVDVALQYYHLGPFHDFDVLDNKTNSCDNLSRRELMRSCILNKTPACKQYAKELMQVWQNDSNANPFSGFQKLDKELLQCLALRDTYPGDETGIFDFFLGMQINARNAAPQEKQQCLYPTEMQAAWFCTGNETMILNEFKNTVENYYLNFEEDMCYGIQNNIVANFPVMGKSVYEILRNSKINGTMKAGLLADFVRVLGPYDLEDDTVINDLDQLLLEYRGNATNNLHDSFYASAVEDLQESADHLKERMKKRNSEYAKSGLRWLQLHGY